MIGLADTIDSKKPRIIRGCDSSMKCFYAKHSTTYFRDLCFEAEYLEWDGVCFQERKGLRFEEDDGPFSKKPAQMFIQEAYQVP